MRDLDKPGNQYHEIPSSSNQRLLRNSAFVRNFADCIRDWQKSISVSRRERLACG
jgi:hypothetical protein